MVWAFIANPAPQESFKVVVSRSIDDLAQTIRDFVASLPSVPVADLDDDERCEICSLPVICIDYDSTNPKLSP